MRTTLYSVLDTMPMDLINIITGYTIGEFNGKMLSKKVPLAKESCCSIQ